MNDEIKRLRAALQLIADAPYTMVNDSESLLHTIKSIQYIAGEALREPPAEIKTGNAVGNEFPNGFEPA